MVQKVTFDIVACGLEGPVKPSAGCCFPVSQGLRLLSFFFSDITFATGSSNLHFSMVQKVTFDIVACGLEGSVKPSAGCCFPASQGLQQAPQTFIFLWFRS